MENAERLRFAALLDAAESILEARGHGMLTRAEWEAVREAARACRGGSAEVQDEGDGQEPTAAR